MTLTKFSLLSFVTGSAMIILALLTIPIQAFLGTETTKLFLTVFAYIGIVWLAVGAILFMICIVSEEFK